MKTKTHFGEVWCCMMLMLCVDEYVHVSTITSDKILSRAFFSLIKHFLSFSFQTSNWKISSSVLVIFYCEFSQDLIEALSNHVFCTKVLRFYHMFFLLQSLEVQSLPPMKVTKDENFYFAPCKQQFPFVKSTQREGKEEVFKMRTSERLCVACRRRRRSAFFFFETFISLIRVRERIRLST